jgi:hypothetical protein
VRCRFYFFVADDVPFQYGQHLTLRLSAGVQADMTAVFLGHTRQISSDHYHHNFTVSQV